MSHPLLLDECRRAEPLTRPHAAVQVRLAGGHLVIQPGVFVAKADSLWVPLPERLQVVTDEGARVWPGAGRGFFISTETFDPFHAVLEAVGVPLPSANGARRG